MPNTGTNRGGSPEQHKAGQQSHKNAQGGTGNESNQNRDEKDAGQRGGTHEQHGKAGQQSHKNR